MPSRLRKECLGQIELLKEQGDGMAAEEYKETAGKVFVACENHIKNLLVQERIGRFQNSSGFAELTSSIQAPSS